MSRKRRVVDSLTGGTGDVNPQWMFFFMDPAVSGTGQEWAVMTPYNRLPRAGGKVTIMEVLKVEFQVPQAPVAGGAALDAHLVCYVTTRAGGGSLSSNGLIANISVDYLVPTAALRGGYSTANRVYQVDVSDGAGHGMLIATDSIIFGGLGAASIWIAGTGAHVRLLYRFKTVSLEEYIGIVQSQE